MKQHARDYLSDYKVKNSSRKWLCLLIDKVLDSNGKIGSSEEEEILKEILKENGLDSQIIQNQTNQTVEQENKTISNLLLTKITHQKGVNALISNQQITFSPNFTLIYGLNGVGKSGYFRIIHEIAGGSKQKKILENVHIPDSSGGDIEVDIDFSLDSGQTTQNYKWFNKGMRGVEPFNQIRVFDSEYLPIFLDERESSIDVKPLGLHLFQVIIQSIERIKIKLTELKQREDLLKPNLSPLAAMIKSHDTKTLILKNIFDENERHFLLNDNLSFVQEDLDKLELLKKQKQELLAQNIEDKKKLLDRDIKGLINFQSDLMSLEKKIQSLTKQTSEVVKSCLEKEKVRDEQIKTFEALQNIQQGREWQEFIESAKRYHEVLEDSRNDECIYCHQKLTSEALQLVQSYSKYLEDQSQKNFKNVEIEIKSLSEQLNFPTDFDSFEIFKDIRGETGKVDNTLVSAVEIMLLDAKNQKTKLQESLVNKTIIDENYISDLLGVCDAVAKLIDQKKKLSSDIYQSDEAKKLQVALLDKDIALLGDKQTLSNHKDQLKQYFDCCDQSEKYGKINQSIGTTSTLTILGSQAENDLLTSKIKKSFEAELAELSAPGKSMKIELEKSGASKGKTFTRLKIVKTNAREVLSEGEQKKVALALFLSEITNQNNKNPVVFDDPVTSLDHEISDKLAKRLIALSKERQVIIFTHNLSFAKQLMEGVTIHQVNCEHHVIDRSSTVIGRVNLQESPKMANINNLRDKYNLSVKHYETLGAEDREKSLAAAFSYLRCACEGLIEESLFAKTLERFSDQVKVQNLECAVLEKEIAQRIVDLHGKISEQGKMHNHSDYLTPISLQDFKDRKQEFESLHAEIESKRKSNSRERDEKKKVSLLSKW